MVEHHVYPVTADRSPVTPEECLGWFDSDGRLVKEAVMRQRLFEVGVDPSCRRHLWKFLFNIYPMASTHREQKTIDLENRANYIALVERWKVLDKTISVPDDDLALGPSYTELSEGEEDDSSDYHLGFSSNDSPRLQRGSEPSGKCSAAEVEGQEERLELGLGRGKSASMDVGRVALTLREANTDSGQFENSDVFSTGSQTNPDIDVDDSSVSDCATSEDRRGSQTNPDIDVDDSSVSDCATSEDRRGSTSADDSGRDSGCEPLKCSSPTPTPPTMPTILERPASMANGASAIDSDSSCTCDFRRRSCDHVLDSDGKALLKILEFPSRVFATRQPVDLETLYPKYKRIILRDVLRTDRNFHFFSHKRNLRKVHRILLVFAMFNPDLGYAQGMNDILARFLVVTGSEVDSYWMFSRYMEGKREDFLENTMLTKVFLVKSLLSEIDEELFDFFQGSECRDYLFCHRWLLLDFKREFDLEDSIRIFEVLCSHHLELTSNKGRVETDKVIAKEFELDCGEMRVEYNPMNTDFTFDLFICVAILIMHSKELCKATDAASVYGCLNGLAMNMRLADVLAHAEYLFYKYCKLSVSRGFSEVTI